MWLRRQVSAEEAERIAHAHAEAQGWPWKEPVRVFREFRGWHVFTNADMRGGNVSISIKARTGEVRRGGFAPR